MNIVPYIPEDLLEIGDYEIVSSDNGCLVVDNWYKNYEEMYQLVTNMPVPIWKWSDTSRNFIDYYDCRPELNVNFPDERRVMYFFEHMFQLMKEHLQENRPIRSLHPQRPMVFNLFKNIKQGVSNSMQHHPHIDVSYNAVVYVDKVSSGGTTLYKDINNLRNDETENLLVDVSKYGERITIPAKPNRLVIFPGNVYHGGYIEDHDKYLDNWRINQVNFLETSGF